MAIERNGCIMPTTAELQVLEADLSGSLEQGRLGFKLFPMRSTSRHNIIFQTEDVFPGLMGGRGLNEDVATTSALHNPYPTICTMPPSSFGGGRCIHESTLTELASPNNMSEPINITELTTVFNKELTVQMKNTQEKLIWDVLTTGWYRVYNEAGIIISERRYNSNISTAGIPWSNKTDSTPLKDIQCLALHGRQTDASFDSSATIWVNQVTLNCLFDNQNPDDLGGKLRGVGCCQPIGLDEVNRHLLGRNLPKIAVYEGRYLDNNRNVRMYLPDGVAVMVGVRPSGVPVGKFYLTRNVVTCGGSNSGVWTIIDDNCDRGEIPRKITVKKGFNGAPALEYPSSIITLYTGCTNDC